MAWKHPNVYIAVLRSRPASTGIPKLVRSSTRGAAGIGKVMWGTDYPLILHKEGLAQIDAMDLKPEARRGAAARHRGRRCSSSTNRCSSRSRPAPKRRGCHENRIPDRLAQGRLRPADADAGRRTRTMDAMIEEGIVAERAGFHSAPGPRPPRRAPSATSPAPSSCSRSSRGRPRRSRSAPTLRRHALSTRCKPPSSSRSSTTSRRAGSTRRCRAAIHPGYWMQFGIPHEKLLGRFLGGIKIWQQAFKGERFDFTASHWQVKRACWRPGPIQEGGWPIWGGGNAVAAAIRRSAEVRRGDGRRPVPAAARGLGPAGRRLQGSARRSSARSPTS